jgi:8-amino-7-oxononanoate synthase
VGDFTSAAYLGLSHPSAALGSWDRIALGKPAAWADPPGAIETAAALARLQGCQRATLATSTLHVFWDLFDQFPAKETTVLVDRGAYAIGRWGVERAAARGMPVYSFAHFDSASLAHRLAADRTGRRPVVLADGYCPECGRTAPVDSYLRLVRRFNGLLVLDDTQAVGILGVRTGVSAPYGHGGGGSLRWHGVDAADARSVVVVASFAKAFGAPVAALSGHTPLIVEFEDRSRTRVHCSPPSVPAIRALSHALFVNRRIGDRVRSQLLALIRRFRDTLSSRGVPVGPGLFPVQSLPVPPGWTPRACQAALSRGGVSAIVTRGREMVAPRISFVFNARHTYAEVEHAAGIFAALHAAPAVLEVP